MKIYMQEREGEEGGREKEGDGGGYFTVFPRNKLKIFYALPIGHPWKHVHTTTLNCCIYIFYMYMYNVYATIILRKRSQNQKSIRNQNFHKEMKEYRYRDEPLSYSGFTKINWRGKGLFNIILPSNSPLLMRAKAGTQDMDLEFGNDTEVIEEWFLLACSWWSVHPDIYTALRPTTQELHHPQWMFSYINNYIRKCFIGQSGRAFSQLIFSLPKWL